MGKKLAEIKKNIENSKLVFYEYLMQNENAGVMELIQEISKKTRVFIFSGVIRNFFLGVKNNRDIDIILEKEVDIDSIFKNAEIKKNSFGGYKIYYNKTTIDLWYLANTWAFNHKPFQIFQFNLERKIPETAFFNFSSIVYLFNEKHFYYEDDFAQFLLDKEIDYVFDKNPDYKLCVINTFYYSDKYDLKIKDRLKIFIVERYNENDRDYTNVQLKHFGKVIYPNDQIEHRVNTIFYPRKEVKKRV